MRGLTRDTLTVLGKAEQKYENAISDIEDVQSSLQDLKLEVIKSLNTTSEEYEQWTTKIRVIAYGGSAVCLLAYPVCAGISAAVVEPQIHK